MRLRIHSVLAAALVLSSASAAFAAENGVTSKHRHRYSHEAARAPSPFSGGRLVYNPALNIACNYRDRATRALPCDQPVWVYGSPCQIDLGLGRWRDCDEPPGVIHGGGYR